MQLFVAFVDILFGHANLNEYGNEIFINMCSRGRLKRKDLDRFRWNFYQWVY